MGRYGDEIAALAAPLADPGDLDVLLDRVGDARVVILDEAATAPTSSTRGGWRSPGG